MWLSLIGIVPWLSGTKIKCESFGKWGFWGGFGSSRWLKLALLETA